MRTNTLSLLAGLLLAVPLVGVADERQAMNPDYLHALPDLRTARWLLTLQPGDPSVRSNEDEGIRNIDSAISTIVRGRFNDHRDVSEHDEIEVAQPREARLQQALELLNRAHAYISKEVPGPDPVGVSVRNGTLEYIDRAVAAIRVGLQTSQ